MALDGFQFVLSRTAILDIFLLFFIAGRVRLPGARPGPPAATLAARDGERARSEPAGRAGRPRWLGRRAVVAAGHRRHAGLRLRGQVERDLVHPRSSCCWSTCGRRGSARPSACGTRGGTRCSTRPAGSSLMVALVVGGLPGHLDRLVRSPTTAGSGTTCATSSASTSTPIIGALQNLLALPQGDAELPRRTDLAAPVPVLALAVAAAGPAGRVLLERRPALRRAQLRGRDPAARHPGAVVGVHPGAGRHAWFGIARRDWRAWRHRGRRGRRDRCPWFSTS